MNITDADREAAQSIPHSITAETALQYEHRMLAMLSQAFAAHRLRGYNAGLEAAARAAARTNANFYGTGAEAYDTMLSAIRSMIEGETDET